MPTEPHSPSPVPPPARDPDLPSMGDVPKLEVASWQIPLLDVIAAATRNIWIIVILVFLGGLLAVYSIQNARPFYTASAVGVLLPREKPLIDATVDTGSLETTQDVARRSSSASLTLPPNSDLYLTLLKSSSTLEKLAERFADQLTDLEGADEDHRSPEMIGELRDMATITGTEDGLLTVSVQSHDPTLAANLANAILEEGENASKEIERQLVLQQAQFLDQAATSARSSLEAAEAEYRHFIEATGVYEPEKLVGRKVAIVANLKARKMRGIESQGMIIAASGDDHHPYLVSFLEDAPIGARLG